MESIKDIVVIGGGLMGSSAAWQLSRKGENTILIEQQDSVYTFGSSLGEARVSRSLGPKNDIFSYLQQRSIIETQELISYLNEGGLGEQHKMEEIYTTSPITYIYYQSQEKEVALILKDQQDTYEYAQNAESALEMFEMVVPDGVTIIREHKKYSGTLNPKMLISKLHKGIKKAGNKIYYNEKVTDLKRKGAIYQIEITNVRTGNTKTILTKKVIAATGPYTGKLLKNIAPCLKELISPKRLFLAFFKIDKNRYSRYSKEQQTRIRNFHPVANWNSEIFYSMIEKNTEEGIPVLKIGGHMLRSDLESLNEVWQKELSKEEVEWSMINTLNYFEMLNVPLDAADLQFLKGYSCVYSLTASEIPLVTNIISDQDKPDPNFVILAGLSGVGAKGSLTFGLLASDLLLKKDDPATMYQKTKRAMGFERLLNDKNNLKK